MLSRCRKAVVFVRKYLGICFSEPVYALLDISHHEYIRSSEAFCRKCLQYGILHSVGILIFVYHYLLELPAKFIRNAAKTHLAFMFLVQKLYCIMLHISEVDYICISLGGLVAPEELCRKLGHGLVYCGALGYYRLKKLRCEHSYLFIKLIYKFLEAVQDVFYGSLFCRIYIFLGCYC